MSRGIMKAIEELFQEACDLQPEQRQAYCKTAYAQIQTELPSLLAAHALDAPLIDRPPNGLPAGVDLKKLSFFEEIHPGTQIGAYRIERILAEGGMGRVYEAWRADGQYSHRVALKVVSFTPAVDRFLQERQILANLDHPNIARLLDGGITNLGNPYIVMEYIEGEPIDLHCQSRNLGIRDRLKLFLHVCDAVVYAHRNLVAHRDLKPNNIFVTTTGIVKLLDFGIAKLLRQDSSEPSVQTVAELRMMTPDYASPEQFCGGNVNAISDVYSLGVLLYKLLTGKLPYDLTGRTPGEQERIICDQEPARPSAAVADGSAAGLPAASSDRLQNALSGDLDNIVLLALRKEPDRRYESVKALREDIQRFLTGDAVAATPTTLVYRAAKWIRRHRAPVMAGCLLSIAMIAGALATAWQALRASREAAAAQAVNDFLRNDLLAQASANTQAKPNVPLDLDMKVRTLLDRAADRIPGKFDRQPEVEAAIRDTIGQTYIDLGLYPKAQTQFARALELDRRIFGDENPKTLRTKGRLGHVAQLLGKYPDAELLLSQTVEVQRRVVGPDDPDTLQTASSLGLVYFYRSKYAEAEALDVQTLQARQRVLGREHGDTLISASNLANVYYQQGKYPQAEAIHSQNLEIRRRVLGPEHPDTLASMTSLGIVYFLQGKYSQAEPLLIQDLAAHNRVLGPDHPTTQMVLMDLGNLYREEGNYKQAEALLSQSLKFRQKNLGKDKPDTLMSMLNLANVYLQEGKYAQAEALYSGNLKIRTEQLGPEHHYTLNSMGNLASVYGLQGKYTEAEELFRKVIEIASRTLGKEKPATLIFVSEFGSMYQRQGNFVLAETYAAQTLMGLRRTLGAEHVYTMEAAANLALADQSQGKFAESAPLAREVLAFNRKKQPDHWQRFRAESLLGASLVGQKKYSEAEPLLLEGYQGMLIRKEHMPASDWYHLDRAREWIVQLYLARGQPQKAAEWRKKR